MLRGDTVNKLLIKFYISVNRVNKRFHKLVHTLYNSNSTQNGQKFVKISQLGETEKGSK